MHPIDHLKASRRDICFTYENLFKASWIAWVFMRSGFEGQFGVAEN